MPRKPSSKGRVRKSHAEIVHVFARQLRTLRRERGSSQINLALQAGVHLSYIGRLERAESAAGIDMVERLAGALGVEPAQLLAVPKAGQETLAALKSHVRANVERVLARGDAASLHALAVVANALAR